LSGCFGAIYTGATTVYNSYDVSKAWNDKWVNLDAINALNADKKITQNGNISVTTVNFVVLLTGHVDNKAIRDKAVTLVQSTPGVKKVVDAIVIGSDESTGEALEDSWITTKIKTKFMFNKNIS